MAKRYTIEELIWLRESPLVARPVSLPPSEEWMYVPDRSRPRRDSRLSNTRPQPDPTPQRKQQSSRDPNSPELTTNRRPSFFEARHISRGSNSEEIVLGPPKIAFASSRVGGKGSLDFSDRSLRQLETDEKTERFNSNFRERLAREKEDSDRRDGKPALNTRRGDKEDWNAGRQRRTEDQDRKSKRNGEFDRWEASPRDANNERTTRDKDGRFPTKKDATPGRGKLEGSWFRDENSHPNPNSNSHSNEFSADADDDKHPVRNREWRRNQHDTDRDWARGPKEKDPEWMDTNGRDDSSRAQAHTQHDFERWKQRMKASKTSNENVEEPTEQPSTQQSEIPSDVTHHGFNADNTMDRFFGTLDPRQAGQEVGTPDSAERKDGAAKLAKSSSRFAGLFSPMPESPAKGPEPQPVFMPMPTMPVPSSNGIPQHNDADQEGFQRILQMLGGGGGSGGSRSNNDTPNHPDSAYRERLPAQQDPRFAASAGPPRQEFNPQEAREREHLLRLMQQVRLGPGPPQQSQPGGLPQGLPPGLLPEMMTRPPPGLTGGPKNSSFPDDPAIANMQRPDNEYLRRRPANGPPPMGYFDESHFHQMNSGQGPITPGGSRQPPGPLLQRPPGLEHMPPPGWTGQPHPQQGNGLNSMGHPPGIPPANRGGMNLPSFPPGMMPPMQGNGPPMNDRQGWRGPPPGMMPPPGYMGGHPPPPGFPPMPPTAEAIMGLGPGGQGPFGPGNPGPQGPPSGRQLLDMFGQPSGGMMGPGPGPGPGPVHGPFR